MRRLSRCVVASLMLIASLVVPATAAAAAEPASQPSAAAHPKLLFGAQDIPGLRQRITQGEPARAWVQLKTKVDSYTTPGHPNYVAPEMVNDPTPLNNQDWAVYEGFFGQGQMGTYLSELGLAYVLSGDEKYGRHAVELLLELSVHWPAWNRNELGEGGLTKGVALGFDWTDDLMTPEERRRITESLVTDLKQTNPGAKDGQFPAPSVFSCLDRDFFFDNVAFNWTGVCGGGNGLTLLAIEGEPGVPDLEPWMAVARDRAFRYFRRDISPWSPTNTGTEDPRIGLATDPGIEFNNRGDSDRWLENASYVRMRNLELGYNLPAGLLTRVGFQTARVYVSGQNLFTITGYKGLDPDVVGNTNPDPNSPQTRILERGVDLGNWPASRVFSVGVQCEF